MESLRLVLDLEKTGFKDGIHQVLKHRGELVIGGMAKGTIAGKPVVMIGLDVEGHYVLVAETTLALFLTAADSLKAKYGDPR